MPFVDELLIEIPGRRVPGKEVELEVDGAVPIPKGDYDAMARIPPNPRFQYWRAGRRVDLVLLSALDIVPMGKRAKTR